MPQRLTRRAGINSTYAEHLAVVVLARVACTSSLVWGITEFDRSVPTKKPTHLWTRKFRAVGTNCCSPHHVSIIAEWMLACLDEVVSSKLITLRRRDR